ncbi:pyridoxamine 5'-phosphate oxidase family protein [Treponema pedis]|uniref:pyridoxamine 5'-phosphate oxidase family protein n=1 Tax=Treponema pedis TaxID=409322 RepID=UPI0004272313|nr:pyridoxamine 5'-phosphate oxidase family protein [Treponema pedis]
MRRKDREITDFKTIKMIIEQSDCIRLGFIDCEEVYIIPLNYGYEEIDGRFIFYFHGAGKGRKIDLIQKNPKAGFELDTNHSLISGNTACSYGYAYRSIIGTGTVQFVNNTEEKKHALTLLMKHHTGKTDWHFGEADINSVCVFKLTVINMTAKERPMPGQHELENT